MCFLVAFSVSAVQGTATKRRTQLLNLNPTARLIKRKIRRYGQAVRQRSATPLSPVRFRVAPPTQTHPTGAFFALEAPPFYRNGSVRKAHRIRGATFVPFTARNSGYASEALDGQGSIILYVIYFLNGNKPPTGAFLRLRRHPHQTALCAQVRRIRFAFAVAERVELARKRQDERIFAKGEIPGI